MPLAVEIILRVPSLTVKTSGAPRTINNTLVRFRRVIEVEAVPAVGSLVELQTSNGIVFGATVARRDWSEDQNLFAVACMFQGRRIPPETYQALVDDPAWTLTELPA